MKRFCLVIGLALISLGRTHADSLPTVNIVQVAYTFSANPGGDNALYSLVGAGVNLEGGGSANCLPSEFCNVGVPLSPGSSVNPDITYIVFESSQGHVTIGGQTFIGPDGAFLFASSITAPSFILPLGGSTHSVFTVTLPASFGVIEGELADGTRFDLNVPSGELVLKFDYDPAANGNPAAYYFEQGYYFVPTPEPGTVGMVGLGFVWIFRQVARKRPRSR